MSIRQRRWCRRWDIDLHARIKINGAEKFTACRIKNLSPKGVQLWLTLRLRRDRSQKLTLVLSKDCCIEVEAWPVWHKAVGIYNVYGLYFNLISPEAREAINRFMRINFTKHLEKLEKEVYNSVQATVEGGDGMEDRRVFQRFKTYFPIRYLDPGENKESDGQVCDISAKGVGFVSKEALKPRTSLEMWLQIPDKGEPLYARGEVMWVKPQGDGEYRCGVSLERADLLGVSRVLRAV